MIKEDGLLDEVVITIASSGFNFSKDWLSKIRSQSMINPATGKVMTPAFWSHSYLIGSEGKTGSGFSWKGFTVINSELVTDAEIYNRGADFNRQMNMSMVKMGGDTVESSQVASGSVAGAAEETAF
jgi:hypothetical protein